MKPTLDDKTPATKVKRTAVHASAVLEAPTEKGQIVTPADATAPAAKPVKVKSVNSAKTKSVAAANTTAPAKTKSAPANALEKSKPVARAAKQVVGEKQTAPEKAAKAKDTKKKAKVVRDSFTMPEGDYAMLAALKSRCLSAGVSVKKSELLRAGLQVLETLPAKKLLAIIAGVENVKTGRPTKS